MVRLSSPLAFDFLLSSPKLVRLAFFPAVSCFCCHFWRSPPRTVSILLHPAALFASVLLELHRRGVVCRLHGHFRSSCRTSTSIPDEPSICHRVWRAYLEKDLELKCKASVDRRECICHTTQQSGIDTPLHHGINYLLERGGGKEYDL